MEGVRVCAEWLQRNASWCSSWYTHAYTFLVYVHPLHLDGEGVGELSGAAVDLCLCCLSVEWGMVRRIDLGKLLSVFVCMYTERGLSSLLPVLLLLLLPSLPSLKCRSSRKKEDDTKEKPFTLKRNE